MKSLVFLLMLMLLWSAAEILLKYGIAQTGELELSSTSLWRVARNPWVVSSTFLSGAAVRLWIGMQMTPTTQLLRLFAYRCRSLRGDELGSTESGLVTVVLLLAFVLSLGCNVDRDTNMTISDSSPESPNIILISIDTLRADHLGLYGYHRSTSPFLDSWVASDPNITLFENAISQYPSTMVSHRAIFTGLYPPRSSGISSNIDPGVKTLPEILHSKGYLTAGFTDGGLVSSKYGFGRGFESYFDRGTPRSGSSETLRMIVEFLTRTGASRFFVFWHTYDVHEPYHPPEFTLKEWQARADTKGIDIVDPHNRVVRMLRERGEFEAWRTWPQFPRRKVFTEPEIRQTIAMYDASIRHVDSNIGKLIQFLKDRDLYDNTLIVLLSDHGEVHVPKPLEYGDILNRVYWKIHSQHDHLSDETVRVPLILKYPKRRSREAARVARYVSAGVDIAPTILDVCGIKDLARFDGKVLSGGARRPTLTFWQNLVFEHIDTHRYRIFRFPTQLDTRLHFEGPPSEYATVDFGRNSIEYPSGFLERIDYSNFSTNVEEFTVPLEKNMGKYFAYPVAPQEMYFAFTAPGTAIAKLKRKVRRTRFRVGIIGDDSRHAVMRLSVTATDENGRGHILMDEEIRERAGGSISRWGNFIRLDQEPLVVEGPVPYERLTFSADGSVCGKWVVLLNGVPEMGEIRATKSEARPIDKSDDALIRQLEALGYLDR